MMKINKDHAVGFPQVKANVKYIFVHNAWGTGTAKAVCHQDKTAKGYNDGNANYYVDDKEIWESVPAGITAWHCGNYPYNQTSIGIEICKDKVSKDVYMKAEARALELTAYFCQKYKLNPDKAIMLHCEASATACPATSKKYYGSYANVKKEFIKKVKAYMNPQSDKIGVAYFMGKDMKECKLNIYPWDIYVSKANNVDKYAHVIEINTSGRSIWNVATGKKVNEWKNQTTRLMYINTALEGKMTKREEK